MDREPDSTAAGINRRPLKTRSSQWAQTLAKGLAKSHITPNQISVASIAPALLGAYLLINSPSAIGLIVVALCIQTRLLCNLLDGMVAIEGGRKSAVGALYNEIPDRIADSLFIVALGYAAGYSWLGWLGALAAAVTAYIRTLGGALGFAQDFRGPMAKPHRMATMTLACLIGAAELSANHTLYSLLIAAVVIAAGATITCGTRTLAVATRLRSR
jgi:phosphatidylglycerophosphate synthase